MKNNFTKEDIFNTLYREADRLIKLHNPCRFKNGVCQKGRLNGCCQGSEKRSKKDKNRYICKYLDEDKGCTIQCLGCKTFLCMGWAGNGKVDCPEKIVRLLESLQTIRTLARGFEINTHCYVPKEQALIKGDLI